MLNFNMHIEMALFFIRASNNTTKLTQSVEIKDIRFDTSSTYLEK